MEHSSKLEQLRNNTDPCEMAYNMFVSTLRGQEPLNLDYEPSYDESFSEENQVICSPNMVSIIDK